MPPRLWNPDGEKIALLREDHGLSQRELSRHAQVDPQTIADIEAGSRRVYSRTLKKLAAVLVVDWHELLLGDREAAKRLGAKRLAEEIEPRSAEELLAFADQERPEPKVPTALGDLGVFGVAELIDISTAPALFDGDRYYLSGEVTRQRALSPCEEIIVDAAHLGGGRFEIARRVELDLPLFTLDVISRRAEHTRALQAHWRSGKVAKLVVRVFVVRRLPKDPDHVSVTNLDGGPEIVLRPRAIDGERWSGFELISPHLKDDGKSILPRKDWCLVVERVLTDA